MKTILTNCASYGNIQISPKPLKIRFSALFSMLQAWRVTINLGLDTSTLQFHLETSSENGRLGVNHEDEDKCKKT